ncbi:MAG: hypothetical protein IPJ87_04920 [Flavobacteriales bacterium]|jgi:hypothetical protein|nr:hypothetical protein [Flavobacteriales bacterium]MBK8948721.1 hypothetical protein [Flavobacteriales bacterium]MBK9701232.1 hypothetical protein [Flavobacteriales bacterium]
MERLRPVRAFVLIALLLLGGVGRDGWHLAIHADDVTHTGQGPTLSESCSLCSEGLPTALAAVAAVIQPPVALAWEAVNACERSKLADPARIPSDRGPPLRG